MSDTPKVILIAEDYEDYRFLLEIKFRSRGFIPLTAHDGYEAFKLISQNHVDIVLTDIDMPRINGIELLKLVHEQFPEMPVFIMTGNSSQMSKSEAMRRGAAGYFAKLGCDVDMVDIIQSSLLH